MRMNTRRLVRWVGILLLIALLTPTAVLLVLYIPPIQEAASQWAAAWLTRQTGMNVQMASLRIQFPLRIEIRELRAGTLLSIERLDTRIRLRPLMEGVLKADYISARGIGYHADTLTGTVLTDITARRFSADDIAYDWHGRRAHAHRIRLTQGYVNMHGHRASRKGSGTPHRLPLSVTVTDIQLRDIMAGYATAQMELSGAVGEIALHRVAVDTTLHVSLQSTAISDGAVTLRQEGREPWELTGLNVHADSLRYSSTDIAGRIARLTFKGSHGIDLQGGSASVMWRNGVWGVPYCTLRTAHSTLYAHLRTLRYAPGKTAVDGDADIRIGHADAVRLAEWLGGAPERFARLYPAETLSASIAVDGTPAQLRLTRCDLSLPTAFDIRMSGTAQGIATPRRSVVQCHIEAQTYDLGFLTAPLDSTLRNGLVIPPDIAIEGDLRYAPDTLHALCSLDKGAATIEVGYRPTTQAYTLQLQTDSLDLRRIMPEGEWGATSLQAHLSGHGTGYGHGGTTLHGVLRLHTLQWRAYTFSNASLQLSVDDRLLHARASYSDEQMQWSLATSVKYASETLEAQLQAQLSDLDMRALQIADTDIRPALRCYATLRVDSGRTYTLHSRLSDIVLSTPTQRMHPRPLDLQATLTADTAQIGIRSGDLTLTASAHTEGLPWQWQQPVELSAANRSRYLTNLQAVLSVGNDNPLSNYLALMGVKYRSIHATIYDYGSSLTGHAALRDIEAKGVESDSAGITARYADGILYANLHTDRVAWHTPQMHLHGSANGTFTWGGTFAPDSMTGLLRLSAIQYTLPAYSVQLRTADTLSIPLERGKLIFNALPLYTTGTQPLLLDGHISLFGDGRQGAAAPTIQARLTARDTHLLQAKPTREALLYGKAPVSGSVVLSGPFSALSVTGGLRLRTDTSLHYIYRDAILTASNQLDNVVTFVRFDTEATQAVRPKVRLATNGLSMSLNLYIDPTAQLEVSLGASQQNKVTLQGGGTLNLQYDVTGGLHLSGKYTIDSGELNMNVPLLHANHMAIRSGSAVSWSGNPRNPQLDITAEEQIRASVTLDGTPQSVLFVTGVSLSDTLEKLGIQFTLTAPENASMQNTLATLAPEERSKLAVALLTTGLYLGEGGTGNLMNTALMSILQSQLDNISRDAFRTVDVSVGIDPLPDGVSGISTRTDYSFSVAKRFWNDRLRIIIGGSVTTSNERIEEDAVIDNISIEWRITPVGNQYLRFFYDKNYESILEGEIREAGVGYVYRRRF